MLPLIIALVALALAVGSSMYDRKIRRETENTIRFQQETIDRYVEADKTDCATYKVMTTTDGVVGVCRYCWIGGYIHMTCIKLFKDPDEEFNQREAEELVEKLNEK